MTYVYQEGHAIPAHESSSHSPHDFCECKPDFVKTFAGQCCYRHNCFDFADLLDGAESIRMIVSIELLETDTTATDKRTFVPFPQGCREVQWPMAAHPELEEDESEYE